jgi:transcriptional regulator with XRE-family HTH domain
MEPRVPKSIKQQVIKQWLQGTSRDQIAKDNGIGAGTVSAIIKDAKQKDIPDIDLLREVALLLKNEDLDLSVLADSIRLKNKIDEMDLSEDLVESFIENINIHCFKRGMKAEEFINIINKVSVLSEKLGMPLDQLPNYLIQKELEVEKMNGEIEDVKMKKHLVLQNYGITMNDLDEYKSNKPLIDRIKQAESQVEKIKGERDYYIQQLRNEQLENAKLIQQWRMSS